VAGTGRRCGGARGRGPGAGRGRGARRGRAGRGGAGGGARGGGAAAAPCPPGGGVWRPAGGRARGGWVLDRCGRGGVRGRRVAVPDGRGARSESFGREVPGPNSRVTEGPSAASERAMARPVAPLERLPRCRTASIGTHVGPAVTRIRRPASPVRLEEGFTARMSDCLDVACDALRRQARRLTSIALTALTAPWAPGYGKS